MKILNHKLIVGHEIAYWDDVTVPAEIFSNIATIDILDYNREQLFSGELQELYQCYIEMVKYAKDIK